MALDLTNIKNYRQVELRFLRGTVGMRLYNEYEGKSYFMRVHVYETPAGEILLQPANGHNLSPLPGAVVIKKERYEHIRDSSEDDISLLFALASVCGYEYIRDEYKY